MGSITIELWLLVVGALAGVAAAYAAKGSNRLIKAAVIGAVVALVLSILRGIL